MNTYTPGGNRYCPACDRWVGLGEGHTCDPEALREFCENGEWAGKEWGEVILGLLDQVQTLEATLLVSRTSPSDVDFLRLAADTPRDTLPYAEVREEKPSRIDILAARVRVQCDRKLGRPTPGGILELSRTPLPHEVTDKP